LHDAIIGERLGLPSVGIMTSNFVSAAALMARALGAEGYRFVVVEHPISSATPEDLAARARKAVAEGVEILRGSRR
jgi:nicotinamidase-related amidase